MSVKVLTEKHLEFLSLRVGCTVSSESTLVKMPHRWKSHVVAQILIVCHFFLQLEGDRVNKGIGGKDQNIIIQSKS